MDSCPVPTYADPTILLLGIGAGCILVGILWALDAYFVRRELTRALGRLELAERKLSTPAPGARAEVQRERDKAEHERDEARARIESALCMLAEGPDAIGGLEAREQAIRILSNPTNGDSNV